MPQMLTKRYRSLGFENGTFLPVLNDLQAGAQKMVVDVLSEVGTADLIGDAAADFPIVDLNLEEDSYKVVAFGAAMSYTYQQMRRENFAGTFAQMNARRESTVTRAIAERHQKYTAYGDTRVGTTGMLNNASVSSTNSTFDLHATSSAAKTFQEIFEFVVNEVETFYTASNNVDMPTTWLVSTEEYFKLIGTVTSEDGTNYAPAAANLKEYLERALTVETGTPFRILHTRECLAANVAAVGAGVTNKNRTVLYVNDPDVLAIHREPLMMLPQEFVTTINGRMVYPFQACTTPVMIHQTPGVRYIDITNVANAASS
jgi:hypothetical protein